MNHITIERAYNEAYEAAQEALIEIENILFLIEKKAFVDESTRLKEVREFALAARNPYVVSERAAELKTEADALTSGLSAQIRTHDFSTAVGHLKAVKAILEEAIAKTSPDFTAIGYARTANVAAPADSTQQAQNEYYQKILNEQFMNAFLAMVEKAIADSDKKHLALREKAVAALNEALTKFEKGYPADSELNALCDSLSKTVAASVDELDIVKDSVACTFGGSLKSFIDRYYEGKRTNGGKERKYERQMARYNRLVARGKAPDWKVAAPSVIDLELVRENIVRLITRLRDHYIELNEAEAASDKALKARRLIEWMKENASAMVDKMTKRRAKNKALKLMEEVGIPEPRKRYRAYPFQFSGGMRQRIVIAIALAANPDILICDEPTTALDVTIQAQILELINRLKKERNLTVIFITHDLGVVANMADRIAVMYAGKIVEYGLSEEVFYSPAHPYTWALLSSMPDLETKEKLEAIPGTPPNMIYPPKGDAFAARNRYALNIDFEEQPPVFPISETHWAATWLLHPDAPKIDPPKAVTDRIAKMKARMGGEVNA